MNKHCQIFLISLLLLAPSVFAEKIIYQNNFEKMNANDVPDQPEFLVINGEFSVKETSGNKYLELPGAPLDTFGMLFGTTTNSGTSVSARIYGTRKGRRDPGFGVGLNGQGGYKLKVSPGKGALEIYKGDDSVASVSYTWKTGTWTKFKLHVRAEGGIWKVEGKAWPQDSTEPKDWMISIDEKSAPHDGRPSIWGNPYSGTPIWFDDLMVTAD